MRGFVRILDRADGSPDGRRALMALEKDGEPLPSFEGQFRLVLPGDKYVGRSVKWLEAIEVHGAEGFVDLPRDTGESNSEANGTNAGEEQGDAQ